MYDDDRVLALLDAAVRSPRPLADPTREVLHRISVRRRRTAVLAGVASVAVVAAGVAVGSQLLRTHQTRVPAVTPTGASAAELAAWRWSALPAASISPRSDPTGVWTGREMIVWGGATGVHGERLLGDGAAYDPQAASWRRLPPSPLSARTAHVAVWTGREMVVWGGYVSLGIGNFRAAADGAAYDPATNAWRLLPAAPLVARVAPIAVWTGREFLVVGGRPPVLTERDRQYADGAAYDPATNRWRRLPTGPARSEEVRAWLWTGEQLMLWTAGDLSNGHVENVWDRHLWALDVAKNRWSVRPVGRDAPPGLSGSTPIWTGDRVVAWGGRFRSPAFSMHSPGGVYDPDTDRWSLMADGPLDAGGDGIAFWTGRALLALNPLAEVGGRRPQERLASGDTAAWDPKGNRWTRLAPARRAFYRAVTVWTGRELLAWGGNDATGARFGP